MKRNRPALTKFGVFYAVAGALVAVAGAVLSLAESGRPTGDVEISLYVNRTNVRPKLYGALLDTERIDLYYFGQGQPPEVSSGKTICDAPNRVSIHTANVLELPMTELGPALLRRFQAPAGVVQEIRLLVRSTRPDPSGPPSELRTSLNCTDSKLSVIRIIPQSKLFDLEPGAEVRISARLDAAEEIGAQPQETPEPQFIMYTLPGTLRASRADWTADPTDELIGEAYLPGGVVPAREVLSTPYYHTLPPQVLHKLISSECQGAAVIGLKPSGVARGYFKGRVLLTGSELAAARAAVFSTPGVDEYKGQQSATLPLMRDGNPYPAVVAHISSVDAIQQLREASIVDFIEPLCFKLMQGGCGMPAYSPSSISAEFDQNGGPVAGGGSNDLIPWAYRHLAVTEAWGREALPGRNIGVGVVDTGVFFTQEQLTNLFPFQRAFSARHLTVMSTLEDNCGHGTRIAGLIAAPKDGRNIMGIAWGAPLTTVRANDDVVHDLLSELDLVRAIQLAHDDGARVIALALGMPYGRAVVADKIKDVFDNSEKPPTIFVAAAGTNLPWVNFPATMNREVVAASTVEVNPGATSTQPQFKKTALGVVGYGSDVDFVGVSAAGELGVPTTGKVGTAFTTNEVVTIGGSSTSTAQLAGVFSLAWSRNPMTRGGIISRMQVSAKRNNISGLNNYVGEDTDVGWGLPDAYAAAGGMRNLSIQGPTTVLPGAPLTLVAEVDGVDFNTYNYTWWGSGAVPLSTGRFLTINAPMAAGTTLNFTVRATDPLDGRFLTAQSSPVLVTQTHLRQLESNEVVDHWSICCVGGRDDTIVYAGMMPVGCSRTALGGEEYNSSDQKVAFPMPTVQHGSSGFTVSPRAGYTSRELVANVHTWWNGGGRVRLRTSWTVAEPQGVDCSVGTFTH